MAHDDTRELVSTSIIVGSLARSVPDSMSVVSMADLIRGAGAQAQ